MWVLKQISLKKSAFIRVEMREEIVYLDRVCVIQSMLALLGPLDLYLSYY
jgi:hypothetical protein